MRSTIETPVEVRTPDGIADSILYRPDATVGHPAIVMFTDVMGIRPGFREMAQRLAREGFVVLLPNVFYRSRRLPLFDHVQSMQNDADAAVLRTFAAALDADAVLRDGGAYVDFVAASSHVNGRIGLLSHSFSGKLALSAAAVRPDAVHAVAMFHAGRLVTDAPSSPHRLLPSIKARLYCAFASNDGSMPAEQIERFEMALREAGCHAESETMHASHGFTIDGHRHHDPQAAAASWRKMLRLFRSALG